ncbi:MAG TPA: cation-translocating P-type ATPase [Candidatus Acidoferrum sp.]|nr:cation-translocating P-type ATPase [Candidatus Acidoferrum sp.]
MTNLQVSGMTCPNCARHVTAALQGVPGVRSAAVVLEAQSATVHWQADADQDIPALITAIHSAGYEAREMPMDGSGGSVVGPHSWQMNLWLGVAVTAALMMGEWALGLASVPWFQWLSFALAGTVQVFAGAQFYRGAWNQLKVGQSNMDTLVALGSTTAFGYSAWALLSHPGEHLYFMEAAAIISLISLGHWLEARVSRRASGALKQLMQLAPPTARKIQTPEARSRSSPDRFANLKTLTFSESAIHNPQSEMEVPVAELKIGDRVALRPGDRIPVDGVVTEGRSAVDEAMLTGESLPVDKQPGRELYAGTANLNGRLVMCVTATGESTALAHIIAAVQRAQTSRADIQRLGDRVSSVFVPAVVATALAAALWWGLAPQSAVHLHGLLAPFLWPATAPAGAAAAFVIAAAVLIIACPCAMGLATPAAIMAAANAAARRGILIRDGVALEKAGQVTAVVFDKTGTLTAGRPVVAEIQEIQTPKSTVHDLAAALARHSTHPLSQVIAKTPAEAVAVTDWREIHGCGVQAKIQLSTARLGSLRWFKEIGVNLAAGEKFIAEWSGQGATIVGLAVDQSLAGLFAIKDTVKPGARAVVEDLQRHQVKTFLLTGDQAMTAAGIARETGIEARNVAAEVQPEQKAEFVKRLQAQGERVAFVGDGLNDAPALEQADLGIAVSRASDLARETADIVLLKSEIEAVPEALRLARATLRTIKQNLFWAFFYNALGVPLAALGFISPILCAAAMGASDLIVIGNALRLLRWRH